MIFVAILTGIGGLLNYAWRASGHLTSTLEIVHMSAQVILMALTVFAAVRYRGRRQKMGHEGYKVFTLPFAVIYLSILGNAAILVAFILHLTGVIQNI